jgi:GMP synthase (glutamine-hydrolysing)
MNKSPRLLVVQPDPLGTISQFGRWFEDAGITMRVVLPYEGEAVRPQLDEDGLVVMGGDMSSLDDEKYPWLEDIRVLMRAAAELQKPTLGVCLGGQLMAQAFGGETAVGDSGIEAGVAEVHWRPEVTDDALFGGLPSPFPVGAMHGDMIRRLPPDAVWLGESALYPHQAYRVGRTSWGIQFHPEISYRHYQVWVDAFTGTDPIDLARVRDGAREFARTEARVVSGTRVVADRFADFLHSTARQADATCSPSL